MMIHHFHPCNPMQNNSLLEYENKRISLTCIPSQTAVDNTHWWIDRQGNSFDAHFRLIGQSIDDNQQILHSVQRIFLPNSSDANESRQSLIPLQRHCIGMQRFVILQWYSSSVQTINGFLSAHCSSRAFRQSLIPSQTDDLFGGKSLQLKCNIKRLKRSIQKNALSDRRAIVWFSFGSMLCFSHILIRT